MPTESSEITYGAESPDEVALCNFARDQEFVLVERKKNIDIKLFIMGKEVHYTLLNTLEFTSERCRSSVIVRTDEGMFYSHSTLLTTTHSFLANVTGKIVLYSKGADNVMFARLCKQSRSLIKTTKQHVEDFSSQVRITFAVPYNFEKSRKKTYILLNF